MHKLKMQYFLGIDSARDVYAEHDGVFQNIFNVNGKPDCSPYYNSPLLPLPTAHVFANTEVIKQTIFGHEAIFRNQVWLFFYCSYRFFYFKTHFHL